MRNISTTSVNSTLNRSIFFFYEKALRYVPILLPVVFMLPASHFFKLCWIWRIPFVYIIGTNAIRIYYRSWFRDRSRLLQKSCELARSFLQDEDTDHPSDKIWWYVNS